VVVVVVVDGGTAGEGALDYVVTIVDEYVIHPFIYLVDFLM